MTITEQIKQAAVETTAPQKDVRYLCRHLHADGRRCGSRALRGESFCYYHHTNRPPIQNPRLRRKQRNEFALSDPQDRTALQLTLGEVLRRIASNQIDPRRAGLLLYGLQIATSNIPRPKSDAKPPAPVEEVVNDSELGLLAPQTEVPPPLTHEQWRQEVERKVIESAANQKMVIECDLRIRENEEKCESRVRECESRIKEIKREYWNETEDLKSEIRILRLLSDPVWKHKAEEGLENMRLRRLREAKEKEGSSSASHEEDPRPADAEPEDVISSIQGSATVRDSACVKLLPCPRPQPQPPRKSAAKSISATIFPSFKPSRQAPATSSTLTRPSTRRRRRNAIASRSRAAKAERAAASATGATT